MAERGSRKSRGERLLERQRILAASPYLAAEISRLRKELGTDRATSDLARQLEDAATWGEWWDANNEEPISFEAYGNLELDRLTDHLLADTQLAKSADDLALRYRYRRESFFRSWLLWGKPPDPTAPSDDERTAAVLIETDPPKPRLAAGPTNIAKMFKVWPSVLKDRKLKSVKVVIEPWTTLDDIKAVWRQIETLQRGLPGYDGERLRARQDLDRDIELHRLVYVEHHTVPDAINLFIDRSQEDNEERAVSPDEVWVRKSLRKLDEQMKPKP